MPSREKSNTMVTVANDDEESPFLLPAPNPQSCNHMHDIFVAIPILSRNQRHRTSVATKANHSITDPLHITHSEANEIGKCQDDSWPTACYTVMATQIIIFIALTSKYGFASTSNNAFMGPPPEVVGYYGANSSKKIIVDGEFWRLFTSLFYSVGLVDLFCSTIMVMTFGACLEKKWGSARWTTVYFVTGESI